MTSDVSPPAHLLPWDSAWFGLTIARAEAERFTDASAGAVVEWGDTHDVDCLYALVDPDDPATHRALESRGFRHVDIRVTLERPMPAVPRVPRARLRQAAPSDRERLETIARMSHRNTRFYADGRFDGDRCDAMYAKWVADALVTPGVLVLVPDLNGYAAGYLTLHDIASPHARIGLLAVAPELQGRGVGTALVDYGLDRLRGSGAQEVSVVTQGGNPRAVRFYERCGFAVRARRFWYHRWFDR